MKRRSQKKVETRSTETLPTPSLSEITMPIPSSDRPISHKTLQHGNKKLRQELEEANRSAKDLKESQFELEKEVETEMRRAL